jgi:hypothetical protein
MQTKKIDVISQKLSSNPSFISLGLKLAGIEHRQGTQVLGESFALNFSNEGKRTIQVIFYSSEDENFFLVNIENNETKDIFNISNWFKKNVLVSANQYKLSNYDGSFENRVELFSEYLDSLLQNPDLNLILKGDDWEKVSFDWAGMR